jgi:phosphatidylserine/phosphatidylglycerophosphate/cardiolipin synthase-like enzyme
MWRGMTRQRGANPDSSLLATLDDPGSWFSRGRDRLGFPGSGLNMGKMFSIMGRTPRTVGARPHPHQPTGGSWLLLATLVLAAGPTGATPAAAQEQLLFPAVHNAQQLLLQKIRNEQVRLDIAVWLLGDNEISQAIIAKHKAGVPVRVLGDRAGIFESDVNTRKEFEFLASNGVPIRLRYHPTSFPEIMHWKSAIFVGQNTVEFGSANYTIFELAPWTAANFKDETAMFTDDPAIFRAFLTMFDRMWADTTNFMDWPEAYRLETGLTWAAPMAISRVRLEPDFPTNVPGMVWSQGPELQAAMIAEIERETQGIDLVSYRLTVPELTDALIRRFTAGVPVRVFIEPTQYRNPGFPEYWLVGAMVDRLWAAGVPVKQRVHQGLTHMKAMITSNVAMHGSSNFTRFWQRDHNYFISAATKPALYLAARDRFNAMWSDAVNYRPFEPLRPDTPALQTPATGAAGVSTASRLVWRRTPWAVAFDVYIGPAAASLSFVGRVSAVVDETPPDTYSFTPAQLQPSTRYYWQVVARTHATDLNPALVASSEIFTFVTGTGSTSPGPAPTTCVPPAPAPNWPCVSGAWIPPAGWTAPAPVPPTPPIAPQPPADPAPPPPAPPTASSCTTVQPAPTWLCINGGWVPPDSPLAIGAGVAPSGCATPSPGAGWTCVNGGWVLANPAPSPPSGNCPTIQPAPTWLCLNGGWVPPDSPLAAGFSGVSPAPVGGCAAPSPGAGWTCVGSVWQPTGHPPAPCGGLPDPFVAIGGGVCISGGWVPRGHPLAGGG